MIWNFLVIIATLLWNTCYKHSQYYPILVCVPIYNLSRYVLNIFNVVWYSCDVTNEPSKVISFLHLHRWVVLGRYMVIMLSHIRDVDLRPGSYHKIRTSNIDWSKWLDQIADEIVIKTHDLSKICIDDEIVLANAWYYSLALFPWRICHLKTAQQQFR